LLPKLINALGFILIIEGCFLFIFTDGWKKGASALLKQKNGQLKFYGLISFLLGIIIIFIGNFYS
tara:strand:+ start:31 stop:225 length:195 start_codon:yes stop_codon:yes gene_type:complete